MNRDAIAVKVMTVLMGDTEVLLERMATGDNVFDQVAQASYAMADAMIKESKKDPEA